MKKIFCLLVVLFLAWGVKPVLAVEPMLKLTPSTGTYTKGTSFEVTVGADTGIVETQAIDVWLKYDPAKVEIESVIEIDNLLENLGIELVSSDIDNTNGSLEVLFSFPFDVQTIQKAVVKGDLFKIKVKPKVAGTINIDFKCVAGESDESSIFDGTTTADMINCPSNINGVYTINESGGTSNPEPTAAPSDNGPTATPTQASELPQTGTVETTIGLMIFGIVSVLSSLALKFL